MGIFTDEYKKLLIVQYADKPKAKAHIELLLSKLENIYETAKSFGDVFDIDTAQGKQLDILGKLVGINRRLEHPIHRKYFGFYGHSYSYGFDDKFQDVEETHTFVDKFEYPYMVVLEEKNDEDFRFFIKAKIIKNYSKATMIDDDRLSIQDVIDFLFDGNAFVSDNRDMSMTINILDSYDKNMVKYIRTLNLIPMPQGVRIKTVVAYTEDKTFGFNSFNTGFGDRFGDDIESYFANKVF